MDDSNKMTLTRCRCRPATANDNNYCLSGDGDKEERKGKVLNDDIIVQQQYNIILSNNNKSFGRPITLPQIKRAIGKGGSYALRLYPIAIEIDALRLYPIAIEIDGQDVWKFVGRKPSSWKFVGRRKPPPSCGEETITVMPFLPLMHHHLIVLVTIFII